MNDQTSRNTDHVSVEHTIGRIKAAICSFPPMPALCQKLLPHINNPDVDFARLSELVKFDPGITMNILRVVNSSRFSGSQRIDSLRQAMVRLGARRLFNLIVSQGLAGHMAEQLAGYDLEPRGLLRHSIGTALAAEDLAQHLGVEDSGGLFTAGLLHDMGKVVMNPFISEVRPQLDTLLRETSRPFDELEKELLGMSHPEAGAQLMEQWNFPEDIVEIVMWHHQPRKAPRGQKAALLIHLADTLVYSQGVGDGIDGFRYTVDEGAAQSLGLRPRDVERIASGILEPLNELETIII